MSCTLAVAAVLMLSDPHVALAATQPPTPVVADTYVGEPLFADIIGRANALKARTEAWAASGAANAAGFFEGDDWTGFRIDAEALAALNMQGHLVLRERDTDGDLKCILRGISEDMPSRVAAVQTAASAAERSVALSELTHLFDDNAAVILAPPHQAD